MVVHKFNQSANMGEHDVSSDNVLRHSVEGTSGSKEKSHSFFRRFQEYANMNIYGQSPELRRASSMTALEDLSNHRVIQRKPHHNNNREPSKHKTRATRLSSSDDSHTSDTHPPTHGLEHSIDDDLDVTETRKTDDGFRTSKLRQNNILSNIRVTGIVTQDCNDVTNTSLIDRRLDDPTDGIIGVKKRSLKSKSSYDRSLSYESDSGHKLTYSDHSSRRVTLDSTYSKSNIPRSQSLMELHQSYVRSQDDRADQTIDMTSTEKRPRSHSLTRKTDAPSSGKTQFQRGVRERSSEHVTSSFSRNSSDNNVNFQRGNPERRSEYGTSSTYYSARANHTYLRRQKWKDQQKQSKDAGNSLNKDNKSWDNVSNSQDSDSNSTSWERMKQYDSSRRRNTNSESEDVRRSRSSLLIDSKSASSPNTPELKKKDRAKSAEYSSMSKTESAKSTGNREHGGSGKPCGKRALPQLPAAASKDVEERRKRISAAALERVQRGLHALRNEVKQELDHSQHAKEEEISHHQNEIPHHGNPNNSKIDKIPHLTKKDQMTRCTNINGESPHVKADEISDHNHGMPDHLIRHDMPTISKMDTIPQPRNVDQMTHDNEYDDLHYAKADRTLHISNLGEIRQSLIQSGIPHSTNQHEIRQSLVQSGIFHSSNQDNIPQKDIQVPERDDKLEYVKVSGLDDNKLSGLDDNDVSSFSSAGLADNDVSSFSSATNTDVTRNDSSLNTPVIDSKYLEQSIIRDNGHDQDDYELSNVTRNKPNKLKSKDTKAKTHPIKENVEGRKKAWSKNSHMDTNVPKKNKSSADVKPGTKSSADVIPETKSSADVKPETKSSADVKPGTLPVNLDNFVLVKDTETLNHKTLDIIDLQVSPDFPPSSKYNLSSQPGIIKPQVLRLQPTSIKNKQDISSDAIKQLIHDLRDAANKPITSNESSSSVSSRDKTPPRSCDQVKDKSLSDKSSPRSFEKVQSNNESGSSQLSDNQMKDSNSDKYSIEQDIKTKAKRPPLFKIAQTCDLVSVSINSSSKGSLRSQFKLYEASYYEGENASGNTYIIRPPVGKRPTIRASGAFAPVTAVTPPTQEEPLRKHSELSLVAMEILNDNSSSPCYQGIRDGDFIIEINGIYLVPKSLNDVDSIMTSLSGTAYITVARPKQHLAAAKGELEGGKEYEKMKFKFDSLKEDADRNLDTIADLRCALKDKDAHIRHLEERFRTSHGYYAGLEAEVKEKDAKVMEWMLEVNKRDRDLARLKVEMKHREDRVEQLKKLLLQQTEVMQLQGVNGYNTGDFEVDGEKVSAV